MDKIENDYLNASFHLGILAGSLRVPLSEDVQRALDFFSRKTEQLRAARHELATAHEYLGNKGRDILPEFSELRVEHATLKRDFERLQRLVSDATQLLQSLNLE